MAGPVAESSRPRSGAENGTGANRASVRVISKVRLAGSLDGIQGRLVEGWVWCPDRPDTRVGICLLEGQRLLGECVANLYRADLAAAGVGDGKHAFSFKLPLELMNGYERRITAVVKGSDFTLPGSPKSVVRSVASLAEALGPTPAEAPATPRHSDFELSILQALASISENLAAQTHALQKLLQRMDEGEAKPIAQSVVAAPQKSSHDKYGPLVDRARQATGSHDVVFFSIIDWHFRIQRPQHLASEFARLGFRVLYLSVQFGKLDEPYDGRFTIHSELAPGVFEVQLKCSAPAPNIYNGVTESAHLRELAFAMREMGAVIGLTNPIAFMQFPSWLPIALALPGVTVVHDCLDHVAGFANVSVAALKLEEELLTKADVVVTSSQYLHEIVGRKRANAIVRNAADVAFFSRRPSEVATYESGPVIGYFGAISEWFDTDLVRECAARHPDWRFILIGSTVGANVDELQKLANVELLGERRYVELPKYLYGFDVCIIPFKLPELIKATNPVKVYEYLCSGKPVVTTQLPEVELIGPPLVHVAKTRREFPRLIEAALKERNPALARKRQAFAKKNSWQERARRYADLIRGAFPKVSIVVLCYNNIDFTRACLDSVLSHSNYPNMDIICVDNGSTDGTEAYLQELAGKHNNVKTVNNGKNLGFAGGNNVGIKAATGEYVIILNNDTYVTPGWIVDLIRPMRLDPKIGMVGPVTNMIGNEQKIVINYANMEEMQSAALRFTGQRRLKTFATDSLAFFCVAISRSVIKRVGLLDEKFGLGFFEDDDYCRRVVQAGFNLVVADDVFVHHHLSASFNKLSSGAKAVQMEKSRKIFEAKWGKWTPHRYRSEAGFGE